jgi:tRNA_anti-like
VSNPADIAATPKKKGCGFWILAGFGILIMLAIIGSLLPEPSPQQKSEMAAKEKAEADAASEKQSADAKSKRDSAVKVTAGQLFAAYQANEMAAQQKYGNKTLEVSGIIDGVDLDFSDNPVVKLKTSNPIMAVSVTLTSETQKAAAAYAKGQKISFLCEELSEVISMPQLKECVPL